MTTRTTERGQAMVLGAIILAGFVVMSLTILQFSFVPISVGEREQGHSELVQDQLGQVHDTIRTTGVEGTVGSVNVELGTQYEAHFLLVSPPDARGTLVTEPLGDLSVENVALSDERGVYYTGTLGTYETVAIRYTPNYNEFAGPETVIEGNVRYNDHGGPVVVSDAKPLVSGTTVRLTTVTGSLDGTERDAVSVGVAPVSTATQSVAVTEDGGPVTIRVPTALDNDTWTTILEDEYRSNGGHIAEQEVVGDHLVLTLETGVEYEFRLTQVHVGSAKTPDEAATHVVTVRGSDEFVPVEGTQKIVVEARDRFENPVPGAVVRATPVNGTLKALAPATDTGGALDSVAGRADENGRVTFVLDAGDDYNADTANVVFEVV